MPRLSLYKPEKGKDFEFIDARIFEMFTIGGTDINVHKYLGPKTPEGDAVTPATPGGADIFDPASVSIQDLLFLENRDKKYEPDIYTFRGIYNVQDIDFNLTQFGLFLNNDTIFITIHIRSTVKTIGRKLIAGDVLELPHLRDEYALNDLNTALKKYYVVEEVSRASEGYSPTWYPHLYRLKCRQIFDSQEYNDIFTLPVDEDVPAEGSLRDLMSNYEKEIAVNDAIIAQAEYDAHKSGFETRHFWSIQRDALGNVEIVTVDSTTLDASSGELADRIMQTPERTGYVGYLLGDGIPPNGEIFGFGDAFPELNEAGDYFLRTDFIPNRLFRFDGTRWRKIEDAVRHTLTNTDERNTLVTSFINNKNQTVIDGEIIEERQGINEALRPKVDNP